MTEIHGGRFFDANFYAPAPFYLCELILYSIRQQFHLKISVFEVGSCLLLYSCTVTLGRIVSHLYYVDALCTRSTLMNLIALLDGKLSDPKKYKRKFENINSDVGCVILCQSMTLLSSRKFVQIVPFEGYLQVNSITPDFRKLCLQHSIPVTDFSDLW